MPYMFQVSKKGFDVLQDKGKDITSKSNHNLKDPDETHLYPVLSLAYFFGARIQLMRYKNVSLKLDTQNVGAVLSCLHETSCLLEDLETVSIYLERCGKKHKLNSLIKTMRHHVRHDVREQFNDNLDGRKVRKLNELGISPHLQTEIVFDKKYIKIGNKTLYIEEVNQYLDWAWQCIVEILDSALEKGYIKDKFW